MVTVPDVVAAPPLDVVVGVPVVLAPVVLVTVAAVDDAPPIEVLTPVVAVLVEVGLPADVLASVVEVVALVPSPEPEVPSGASADEEHANPTSERPTVNTDP